MRSRVDVVEGVARGVALAILAGLLLRSLRRSPGEAAAAGVDSLWVALVRWSTAAPPARVHLRIDRPLAPAQRDWLAALASTGTRVTWEARDLRPLAAVADAVADPAGATRVRT